MSNPYGGGKPIFNEFITPIGLCVHTYHDQPQLKTSDQHGNVPDIDAKTGIQRAEYKVTLAWDKSRMAELNELIQLAHTTKAEAWPESAKPGAFFSLQPFFRDGDNPDHNTKGKEYLFNKYYLNFKAKADGARVDPANPNSQVIYSGAPGLLGPQGPGHTIMPADWYPGCTGRVSGIMFGTEYMGKHFISVRLNNIQKYEDGERIGGGRPDADSQFDSLKPGGAAEGMGAMAGML